MFHCPELKPTCDRMNTDARFCRQSEESQTGEGHAPQADAEEARQRGRQGEHLPEVGGRRELQTATAPAVPPRVDAGRHGACQRERVARGEDDRPGRAGAGAQGDVRAQLHARSANGTAVFQLPG